MQLSGATNENEVFAAWRSAEGDEKQKFLPVLVKLLQKHAHSIIWNRLGRELPEVVNEAVWIVLEKSEDFRGDAAFSTWFHEIVNNLCNRALREIIKGRREVSLDYAPEPVQETSVEESFDTKELLGRLTKRQRQVLELALQGLTWKEIADRMDINKDGVKYIFRTLKGRALKAGLRDGKGKHVPGGV